MQTDIEIARATKPEPIATVAERIGIPADALLPYGKTIAKIDTKFVESAGKSGKKGKLILVTAINPTAAGEGKTTTTVGLSDALRQIGKKSAVAMREPSLGPCFGVKGGAAGGGHSQVIPMEQINLHFTGDFHAITSANNLLAALIDNHIYHGNKLNIDPRRVTWARAVDMNDRSLRDIVIAPRRRRQRLSPPDQIRHHRRLRDHGGVLPGDGHRTTCRSASPSEWSSASTASASRSRPSSCNRSAR